LVKPAEAEEFGGLRVGLHRARQVLQFVQGEECENERRPND